MINFVGSEVDVVTGIVTRGGTTSTMRTVNEVDDEEEMDHHSSVSEDAHPPISPKGGAESLFLKGLETQQISAFALAQIIRQQYRIDSTTTVATDDYVTAVGCDGDGNDTSVSPIDSANDLFFFTSSSSFNQNAASPFHKDALVHSRSFDHENSTTNEHYHDTMSTPTSTSSTSNKPTDPAEKVYDTAKNVWGWGKTVTILSPFLGLAEGAAKKVVGLAGTSLEQVDGNIQHHLESLDGKYLNPAIAAIVNMLVGTMSKSEELLKPILQALLKPVGLIKNSSEEAKNPEITTPVSGTTTTTVPAVK